MKIYPQIGGKRGRQRERVCLIVLGVLGPDAYRWIHAEGEALALQCYDLIPSQAGLDAQLIDKPTLPAAQPMMLSGSKTEGQPNEIVFNGIGEDSHETFMFRMPDKDRLEAVKKSQNDTFMNDFCKTARKPYDLVVCLNLLTLRAYMPNLELYSDGFSANLPQASERPKLDGVWEDAIEELKEYGIEYEVVVLHKRPPYCDLGVVLKEKPTSSQATATRKPRTKATTQPSEHADQNEVITCPICGFTGAQLLTHLRDAHQLAMLDFHKKYAGSPVFSAGFLAFAREHNLRLENGVGVLDRDVLGVKIIRSVASRPHVPHEDQNYFFDEKAPYVLRSLLDNDRILLVGHTGCGKSSLIEQLAARLNHPVRRFNLHGEVSATDFLGQWVIEEDKMVYRYGVLPTAMKDGQILVLEELDAADPSVLFILQGVLEDGGKLVIPDNGGEIIEPHKDFRLCATANTLGMGDDSGLYAGTRVLNASHLDRWSAVFELSYLPPEQEAKVLTAKVPTLDAGLAGRIVQLANAVRKAASEEQLCCTFSTRRLLALASKAVAYSSPQKALEVTVLSKLSPADRAVVAEIAQRIL